MLASRAEAFSQTFEPIQIRTAFEWVASDDRDNIAIFWPCEFGPVPSAIHQFSLEEHLDWCRCLYQLSPAMLDGDNQVELPDLGFYFFSLENHESYSNDGYQRLGSPSQPKTVSELPEQFRRLVSAVRFPDTFSDTAVIFAAKLWPTV